MIFLTTADCIGSIYNCGDDMRWVGSNSLIAALLCLVVACASPSQHALAGPPEINGSWYLTFESEFDAPVQAASPEEFLIEQFDRLTPRADDAKWEYRDGPNKSAYAVEDNVFITRDADSDDSVLVLRTSVDERANQSRSNPFRTGFIRTRNYENTGPNTDMTFSQRYGYFEARMKLDTSPGQWGAFWLMPLRSTWCADGSGRDGTEIDIVEGYPHRPGRSWNRNRSVNFAIHYDGYHRFQKSEGSRFPTQNTRRYFPDFDAGEFHTYGFLWTPEKYVWFVDGIPVYQITDPDQISQVAKYLKLSTEVAPWSGDISRSSLPADTLVDWVRVWQTDELAAGNPYIFEVEDTRLSLSPSIHIHEMRAGTYCSGAFARTTGNRPGTISIPMTDPVQTRQIGIRATNPVDPTSEVHLHIDGELEKTWSAIDLDQVFVLRHQLDREIQHSVEISWTGGLAINQVYLVPEDPMIELR